MKLYKKFLSGALAGTMAVASLTTLTGCNDMLDTKPQGIFTENQIGEDQIQGLMTGAYASLLCHFFGNNESFAGPINNWVFDVRSDDAYKGGGDITMESYIHQMEVGNIQSNSDILNFKWRNNYYSIARCNVAIRAVLNAENLSDKDALVAELKCLRAYFWFDLYRLFAKFPFFTESTENPSTVSVNDHSREEIIAAIKQDLRDAYELMPEDQPDPGRFNRYVAAALMARVSLFTSTWDEAEKYAGYVINSNKYHLFANFLDMSKPEFNNGSESVLAIQFSSANSPEQYNFNNCLNCTYSDGNLYGNGDDFYLASQNLVNAFRTDADGLPLFDTFNDENVNSASYAGNVDPRLDFTVGRIGMPWRSYEYNIKWCRAYNLYGEYSGKKPYPSPDSPYVEKGIVPWGASSLNCMLIRYADVMLMKAEALIEQGKDLEQARRLINDVRKRAADSVDANYTPVDCNPMVANYACGQYPAQGWNQDYARKAVRMERRLELAMEGHRWFDLLRWGIAVETMNAYYASEVHLRSYYAGAHCSESDLYLPVPLAQLDNAGDLYK